MSLLNLIVHPQRAYVITDSGYYGAGGVVSRLFPKSMVLEHLDVIIASAGKVHCGHLAKGVQACQHLPQAEFLEELPNIARAAVETYKIAGGSIIAFAAYSQERGCAFGGIFAAADDPRAYRIIPKSVMLSPGASAIDEATLSGPSTFNPYLDLMPLIEEQRRYNFGTQEQPICGIAGDIDMVTVSPQGITVETIHTYPAEVGEKVAL